MSRSNEMNVTQNSSQFNSVDDMSPGDAAWILSNTFRIFTMQTGFGMLEAGSVSKKNVANIMMKNLVDVSVGGLAYWVFGYGFSFGSPSNFFCGFGNFFMTTPDDAQGAKAYTHFIFHMSFATAATTIFSGAVAERMKFSCYVIFSFLNIFAYCFPASWVWHSGGFLRELGFFDHAGASVVHLTGGVSAVVGAVMIGPRLGRFSKESHEYAWQLSSPVTALTGTFMLWWAWLAFNCGSSFGMDQHGWLTAAKSGITTMNGSIGGSLCGLLLTMVLTKKKNGACHLDCAHAISAVLGGLVAITAACPVVTPGEAILIGAIGGSLSVLGVPALEALKIDDPVGAIAVHFVPAIWATLAVGIFGRNSFNLLGGHQGLLYGGGFYLLGIQLLGTVIIAFWSFVVTLIVMNVTIGIRMSKEVEILGADWVEHKIFSDLFAAQLETIVEEAKFHDKEGKEEVLAKILKELQSAPTLPVSSFIRTHGGTPHVDRAPKKSPRKKKNNSIITLKFQKTDAVHPIPSANPSTD